MRRPTTETLVKRIKPVPSVVGMAMCSACGWVRADRLCQQCQRDPGLSLQGADFYGFADLSAQCLRGDQVLW